MSTNNQAASILVSITFLSALAGLLLTPVLPLLWWQNLSVGAGVGLGLFVLIGFFQRVRD